MSTISLDAFLAAMRAAHGGALPLNADQLAALEHDYLTPLWIIAGPGTGKTHTLVWLLLKRVLVDGIDPRRTMITTFTRKAAAELESRLIQSRQRLRDAGLVAADRVEIPQMRIGTLHSICSDILQQQHYPLTMHVRLLADELTQQFFIRRSRNPLMECDDLTFWQRFEMLAANAQFPPGRAAKAQNAATLFNRLTENSIEPERLHDSRDPHFALLADGYLAYREALVRENRTDQAHLQQHLLAFLDTDDGANFLADGFTVLVDEYQDTNPIQERIYFQLCGQRGDLTVVGDDDQSLYRFRGATVESLIDFDSTCERALRKLPTPVYLSDNRRSHDSIVDWVNRYIDEHPAMSAPGVRVRAPNKPPLRPAAELQGSYPAVMAIAESTHRAAASKLSAVVTQLIEQRYVSDLSQIALLTFSTRETTHGIGAYTTALRDARIPFVNPRNRQANVDTTLLGLLGAIVSILDPTRRDDIDRLPRGVPAYVDRARQTFAGLASEFPPLNEYVTRSAETIARSSPDDHGRLRLPVGGERQEITLSMLFYSLLAREPFATRLSDAVAGERLKAFNQILSEYESLYDRGRVSLESVDGCQRVATRTLYDFFGVFVEGIHDGLNDPEDEEITVQPGTVNVMTVHQAKGLEFEVVFVLRPDKTPFLSETHILEDLLDPFATRLVKPQQRRTAQERAEEDAARLFFVAYSRAKQLLVLTGASPERWTLALGLGFNGRASTIRQQLATRGVHLL